MKKFKDSNDAGVEAGVWMQEFYLRRKYWDERRNARNKRYMDAAARMVTHYLRMAKELRAEQFKRQCA